MNMDNNLKIIDKKWDMEYQTSFYDEVLYKFVKNTRDFSHGMN